MRIRQKRKAVLLLDTSNIVARSTAVANDRYLPLFCSMLLKQRRDHPHHQFVFAVEGAGTLRRQRILPCYKEGRIPSPEFNEARSVCLDLLQHVNCQVIRAADGEADDAIASYCKQHPENEIVIVSNDRDLWQLICTNVFVLTKINRTATKIDRFACRRHLGVKPSDIPIMKALLGDNSDNIPRAVSRVQKKKLIKLVGLLDGSLEKLPELVTDSDWLTDQDKKKILLAQDVVKQHLKVTVAWNLKLKQKRHKSDPTGLYEFLFRRGQHQSFSKVELQTIAGKK